jgi:hypothetical protein
MSKKLLLWVLAFSIPLMSASCFSHRIKQEKVGKIERWQNSQAEIFAVQKTTGEHIEFSREVPAGISNDCVLGLALQETVVDRSQIKRFTVDSSGKLLDITDQSGQTSQVLYGKIEGDKVRYITSASPTQKLSVPLSEIELVWVKRVNPWPTARSSIPLKAANTYLTRNPMGDPSATVWRGPNGWGLTISGRLTANIKSWWPTSLKKPNSLMN